jgi:glycosyltransferase involved in cell wall biosynthesis
VKDSGSLSLAYSIADQNFVKTKSLGILNLSLQLGVALSARPELARLELFSNSSLRGWREHFAGRNVHYFDHASATRPGRMFWDQYGAYSAARTHDVQWLFLPKGFASFCRRPPIRLAAYVHDAIGEWYRSQYPGTQPRIESWYFNRSLVATLRYSTVVFTNSDFTRRELLAFSERHAIRPPDIVVAGIGFDTVATAASADRCRIVVLASPWQHKRTDLAMRYMSDWQRTSEFSGQVDWVGRFPAGVNRPSHSHWHFHERLDEDGYRSLLSESRAVVYVSEYEGFGMPPVEAVCHGACPVYSDIPATRETMRGEGAPFENASFESFTAAMTKALAMQPSALSDNADRLRRRYNWTAVADRIIGALTAHLHGGH